VIATVEYLPDGRRTRLDADVIVYATGYRPSDPTRVLGRTGFLCRRDGAGRLGIRRDYGLDLTIPSRAGLFVTGASEYAHGFSSTLLSNVAVRAGEILESVLTNLSDLIPEPVPDVGRPLEPVLHLASESPAREAS
jgi:L-ornithine N5-oxygenase